MAGAITALMTGRAYRKSAEVAAAMGPYDRYELNREPHNHVMRKHRDAALGSVGGAGRGPPARVGAPLMGRGRRARRGARLPQRAGHGARAHGDDLVPHGLRHHGHRARLLAGQVQGAGGRRPDDDRQPDGAPGAARRSATRRSRSSRSRRTSTSTPRSSARPGCRRSTCRCSTWPSASGRSSHMGHMKMMAAAQPFLSGAISKTVNLPAEATIEDVAETYMQGWKLGLKALAIYRDGSKTAQALRTEAQGEKPAAEDADRRGGQGGAGRGPAAAPPDAEGAPVDHAQVLDRRARGLHHGRHVRGRHGRRDLPDRRRQGGLDAARHDERVRHLGLDRAPVRRAARDPGAQVQLHALRPGGHHRQPGDPVREVDARLHHALAGVAASSTRICRRSWGSSRPRCGRGSRRRRRCCAATRLGLPRTAATATRATAANGGASAGRAGDHHPAGHDHALRPRR